MAARLVGLAALLMVAVFAGAIAGNATVAGLGAYTPGYALPAIGDERAILAGGPYGENPIEDAAACRDCQVFKTD